MVSFLVFSDLHYKEGMYAVKVRDLKQIMARAKENGADFVLHAGDFCNGYKGSPEIVKEYLENQYTLQRTGYCSGRGLSYRFQKNETAGPASPNASTVYISIWHIPME